MKKITSLFLNDKFILLLIIVNTITIFSEGFESIEIRFFNIANFIDSLITVLFVIEALVKILHLSWRKYFQSNWNKLDFLLIILSLPSLLMLFANDETADISFLLVIRISRVFKFLRFFKFIPGIVDLAKGVRRALRTSVVVLFGFIIYNFIISILSCYLFKNLSPDFFGNPIISFYSTFKVFTVEGWYEIPDEMSIGLSGIKLFFIKLYFVIILITGGIFGLSIVNSIFVDSMVSDNNDDLERKIDELNKKIEMLITMQEKK